MGLHLKMNSNVLHWLIRVHPTVWENTERQWVFLTKDRSEHLSKLSFYFIKTTFFFFSKLICTETSIPPSSGLKAILVGHQVWFSTSDNFFRGGNGLKLDSLAAHSSSKLASGNTILRGTASLLSFPESSKDATTNPERGGGAAALALMLCDIPTNRDADTVTYKELIWHG